MILTEDISELIGIILGDGHISFDKIKHSYLFSIYLNGIDEEKYLNYVRNFLLKIFKKEPIQKWERDKPSAKDDAKGVSLTLYGKEIVKQLLELGLISGNKVKNQVGVPSCVFSSENFIIRCLKGLFDTDGSIFLNKSRKSIYLSFSNGSMNLVEGFIKLCKKIGIVSHFYGPYNRINKETGKVSKAYSTLMLKKETVKNFLTIVNPEKWKDENRCEFIGTLLILLKNPNMYKNFIREYKLMFQNKEFKYSLQSLKFLRNFCYKLKLDINKSLINTEITDSFEFKYLNYNIEFAEYLKDLSIKKGSIREVVKSINKKYRITTKNYIKKLFLEPEYSDLYGNQGYSRWLNHNFEVLIDNFYDSTLNERVIRVRRLSFDIKKEICVLIFSILKSSNNQKLDTDILNELTYLINNLDLNSSLTREDLLLTPNERFTVKPKVLLFERLSFLLSNSEYNPVINNHLSILIKFIREILRLIKLNEKIDLENLRKHVRNKLKINWRSDNIKKILVALDIYEKLIIEILQDESAPSLNNLEIRNNLLKDTPKESPEKDKIVKRESGSYPKYKKHKVKFAEEDFTDPYLWFSPQVREAIRSKAESLIDQVHEGVSAPENFSDPWDKVPNYDSSEAESISAEDLMDDPEEDIIPDQDIEPDSEDSEAQEGEDAHGTEITGSDEEIEDLISEQEELTEDQISDLEQINDSDDREGDIKPDDFDPIIPPDYDPLPQPITELIPPPEPSTNPEDISTPGQEKDTEAPNSPHTQQEQDESSQVPEKTQDEVGTEQNIEEISNDSKVQDIDEATNDDIEQIQNPDLGDSSQEDLPDDQDINPEDADSIEEEKEEIEDKEEQAQDEKNEEDNKDESEDEMEREKDDDIDNLPEEIGEESQEGDHESDSDSQEGNPDDMDDFEDDSEIQLTPEQIINIMIGLAEQQVYPENHSMQSSNLDPSSGDVIIIDEGDLRELIRDIQIGDDDLKEKETKEVPSLDDDGAPDDLPDDEIKDGNFDNDLGDFL